MKNLLLNIVVDVAIALSAYLTGTVVTLYVIDKQSHGCMPVAKPKPVVLVAEPQRRCIIGDGGPCAWQKPVAIVPSRSETILSIDKTGAITVRGKPATDEQIGQAFREWALLQRQSNSR